MRQGGGAKSGPMVCFPQQHRRDMKMGTLRLVVITRTHYLALDHSSASTPTKGMP
jgi:hypothetical protein